MSATWETAKDDVLRLFTEEWRADPQFSYIRLHTRMNKNDPPDSFDSHGNPIPFVEYYFLYGPAQKASLGSFGGQQRWRRFGSFQARIFTAYMAHSRLSDQIVDKVLTIFEGNVTPNGVIFRAGQPEEFLERDQDKTYGRWFQVNVSVPFEFDQVK